MKEKTIKRNNKIKRDYKILRKKGLSQIDAYYELGGSYGKSSDTIKDILWSKR